jgi:ribose transport system substrate-binding protein
LLSGLYALLGSRSQGRYFKDDCICTTVDLELLKDGYLSGLWTKILGMGMIHSVALDYIVNNKRYESWTDSGMDIVTIKNVDAMIEAWETQDFTKPLPPAF